GAASDIQSLSDDTDDNREVIFKTLPDAAFHLNLIRTHGILRHSDSLPGGLKRNPERKKHFLETSGETVSYMKRIRKLQVSEYLWKTSPTGNSLHFKVACGAVSRP